MEEPTGFATQLTASDSREGWQAYRLPFQAHHIEDALSRLIHASGVDLASIIPEARAFMITDSLRQSPQGSSINIAALLAVIDTWNDNGHGKQSNLLRCCCSFVKPMDDELRAVGSLKLKLDAFIREYSRGSLVVCTAETAKVHALEEHFDAVWIVESFADLASWMLTSGLLEPLLAQHEISLNAITEAAAVIERIRRSEGGSEAALKFAHRMQKAVAQGGAVTIRVSQRSSEALENVHRHIGNFAEACEHSLAAVETLGELGEHTSFQELAEANARLGSALFDAHRFSDGVNRLGPLVDEANAHPRLLSAESRVMLFNTHARLLAATGQEGWEPLFQKSIRLQELVEPTSIARTRCYLVLACLRNRPPEDARRELDWFDQNAISDDSLPYVRFYRADLYRRDPECGAKYRQDDDFESTGSKHAFGFYLQATARQPDRDQADRQRRLEKAIMVFANEIGDYTHQNILHLVSLFIGLETRPNERSSTLAKIASFFESCPTPHLENWYVEALGNDPPDVESLLNRFPFF